MFIELKTDLPGPESQRMMLERECEVARGPFHVTPIFLRKAYGAILEDVDGNRLLDFAGGIGVVNTGHSPAELVGAVTRQAEDFMHAGFNVTPYHNYVQLAKKLNQVTPGNFPKKTFLANSGAEAVENAIKMARAFTKRSTVVCFDHAFHGRTYMAMSLTSKAVPYKEGFGPFNGEIYRAPFPYCYRWPTGSGESLVAQECFEKFEETVHTQIGEKSVAAVIIEPVLGEGGFVPAPKEFLARLRNYCTQHGIVLIADEIQTGFGRAGALFACEPLGLVPDLITMAKGLGGGMPLSAVTGRAEIIDAPPVGGIGGTYAGNPISCAVALEVLKKFEQGDVLANGRTIASHLERQLVLWREKFQFIGDVRGLGPMRALEFVKDRETKEPAPDLAKALIKSAWSNGVVLMSAGSFGNVVRFLPPLIMSPEQLMEGLAVVEKGLHKIQEMRA